MKDLNEIKTYYKNIKDKRRQIRAWKHLGIVSYAEILLHLLRDYADIIEQQDKVGVMFKKFFFGIAHITSRCYKTYTTNKLKEIANAENINLDTIITDIDNDISGSDKERKQLNITTPHNPLGSFQSLWVAFFYKFPQAFNIEQLEAKYSIIRNCHAEAARLPAVYARRKISKDAWRMIGEFAGSSLLNLALADKTIYNYLIGEPSVSLKEQLARNKAQRRNLLKHVEEWEIDQVQEMLKADSWLVTAPWYNAESDVIRIACLDQNKEMYELLISHLPKIEDSDEAVFQTQLNEFHYLVRGGQRGRAEKFLEKFYDLETRERLIFGRNYQGFSAINYYALDNDVEGRLRLYRQLTDNPAELKQKYQELYPENIKPEQEEASWDAYFKILMSKLDEKYKAQAAEHINEISNDKNLADQFTNFFNKYKAAFERIINHYKKREWSAGDKVWVETIGKIQRKMPRWLLYEICRPGQPFYDYNNPDKLLRTGHAAEPNKLDFTLEANRNLFTPDIYKDLGKLFGVVRGGRGSPGYLRRGPGRAAKTYVVGCRAESQAVSREIKVTQQKSIKESRALQPPAHVLKK